jgi:Uma2 family endonuclease
MNMSEYWIVDPLEQRITILRLAGPTYEVHGQFAAGAKAASALLPGFEVDVTEAIERSPQEVREDSSA